MSIEDRLFALAQQYRDRNGAAALGDATQFVPQLSSQAPDLHVEIKALSAAVQANAAARITSAANADLEAQAIAAEIAGAQKLSIASVAPAVAVARRLGSAPVMMPPPTGGGGGWAGDSVIAGSSPPPPYAPPVAPPHPGYPPVPPQVAPAAKPYWQNKYVLGGLGVALLAFGYQNMNKPQNGPGPLPPEPPPGSTSGSTGSGGTSSGATGGDGTSGGFSTTGGGTSGGASTTGGFSTTGGGSTGSGGTSGGSTSGGSASGGTSSGGGGGFPALGPPNGQLPTLAARPQGQGFIVGFSLSGVPGIISLPPGGWDGGNVTLALMRNPQGQQPDSMGGGKFQRIQSGNNPVRVAQIQWQQDNIGVGPACIAFIGNGGQDVKLSGARMCLMDGACNQPLGCGQIP